MAPRYTRKITPATVWWARGLGAAVVMFPLSLSNLDFRATFARGVSVAAYKSSPAYAAFEDLKEDFKSDYEIPDRPAQLLAAGNAFDYKVAKTFPRQRHIAFKGLTVKQPPVPVEAKPTMVASQTVHHYRPAAAPVPASSYHMDPQDGDAWSIGAVARRLVEKEMSQPSSNFNSSQRVIVASNGTPIQIADTGTVPPPSPLEPQPAAEEPQTFVTNLAPVAASDASRELLLNGQIEMTGGLAFVGPETQILVKRVHNGEALEKGRIWVTEGRFEIQVKAATGYLVAELFTRDGRVLGRGEMNLFDLREVPARNGRINDIRLALRPTTDTASLRTVSDYSPSTSPAPVKEARVEIESFSPPQAVNDEGFYSEPSLDRESTFVARASANKNWSSLVVGQASRPQDIRLFSNSLVEALVNLNLQGSDRREAMHMGVVWGQISRDGVPVTGAQVEMAGDFKPVYFNAAFIPDPGMKATGKNGLFAFLKVKRGVQAVRVMHKNHMYPAQIFPTEEKHVSYLELELRDKVVSQFKVVDILTDKPVSARIRPVGTDAMLEVSGDQFIEYSAAASTFMVEADAGAEYEISRTTLSGAPQLVPIPMVKREWLSTLAYERGIAQAPARGIVMGFIDDQDFEVEMTGSGGAPLQIVYFDAQGKALSTRMGVAGGGFAIFNAPPGLQTVFVHPVQSKESFSQIVVAEPEYVHVMAWSARR